MLFDICCIVFIWCVSYVVEYTISNDGLPLWHQHLSHESGKMVCPPVLLLHFLFHVTLVWSMKVRDASLQTFLNCCSTGLVDAGGFATAWDKLDGMIVLHMDIQSPCWIFMLYLVCWSLCWSSKEYVYNGLVCNGLVWSKPRSSTKERGLLPW